MFLVLLRFAANRAEAPRLMAAHNLWIGQGFEDGVFLVTGSVPGVGGAVLTHGVSREALDARVRLDPFVAEGVVEAEIIEIAPGRTDERLAFLRG